MRFQSGIAAAVFSVACIASLQAPAWAREESLCGLPATIADGWEIAGQSAIANPGRLCALVTMLDRPNSPNVHAVVLVRHGRLLFEHYRRGYKPEFKHDVRSISKSVVSILVGVAIDRHLIASVDEPVYMFFPEFASLRSPEKDRILLRHLLTMSSGIKWNENLPVADSANSERRMTFVPDSYRYAFEQPMVDEPGKVWNYSGGSTTLLAAIVEKASKERLFDFAREVLFTPLGITDVDWLNVPNGQPAAASGLRLRPRDLAKIGQLVLSRGAWKGNRIVSAAWLQESIEPGFTGWNANRYGYQWWLGKSAVNGRIIEWIAGFGFGGQRVYIIPAYDAVAVVTAGIYKKGKQDLVTFDVLNSYILPAIDDEQAKSP